MADKARNWTDKHLAEMETHIRRIYLQAQSDITKKWNDYMARGQARLDLLYNAYLAASADAKKDALEKYQDAVQSYTLRNKWYKDMVNTTAYRLAHTNEIALSYINGEIPSIYVTNYNYIDPALVNIGVEWTLVNENVIKNLTTVNLPIKTLNIKKDMAWNVRQMNNSVLQGILQGENITKIAARLLPIVNNNTNSAIRNARTMVTGAENHGRFDRLTEYVEKGVVLKKEWIATPDSRTRPSHLALDGEEVDINKPFSNKLMYPGDPNGPGEEVWNCRCAMGTHIIGFRRSDGSISAIKGTRGTSLHDTQMSAEKKRRKENT